MRVVLDTAVMVVAIRSGSGASRRLLEMALRREGLTLLVSVPLLIEYEAVMTPPEHLTVAGLTASEVSRLLDAIAAIAEPVTLAFLWRPLLPDADDDMVLETAMNGGAEAMVTFNHRDFTPAARRLGLPVLLPGELLIRLERGTG
jgi:putative PIN family toxin of toxin-antitoxin system